MTTTTPPPATAATPAALSSSATPAWTPASSSTSPRSSTTTVTQANNADAAVYVSTLPAKDIDIEVELTVNTTSDDDFIGFVLGFDSGDGSSSGAEWLLFDWKQGTQRNSCDSGSGNGDAGTALSLVTGAVSSSRDMWCHQGAVAEIDRGTNYGSTGWADNTTYDIEVSCTATTLDISIDGASEFSETGTFDCGNFGFYNYSQQSIEYTLVSPVDRSVCSADLDTDGDGVDTEEEIDQGDTDGDEVNEIGTDPNDPDTDAGGVSDGDEVLNGTNPLDDPSDDFPGRYVGGWGACSTTPAPTGVAALIALLAGLIGLRRKD